jgi:hypothetical protein
MTQALYAHMNNKIIKKNQQGLLISYSSPYNKFKILVKANLKIQATK